MQSRGSDAAPLSRLEALRRKHAMYKTQIKEAQKSPATASFYLTQLKKQKLQVKEEIEGITAKAAGASA